MQLIPLTRNLFAQVDDADVERLNRHSWYAMRPRRMATWYAATRTRGKIVLMHRMIIDAPTGLQIDHRNHDGLDNQRVNLRLATPAQNQANRRKAAKNKGYKGVYKLGNRFVAYFRPDGRKLHLGCFGNAEDAARAYDAAARKRWGEFACTNFPEREGVSCCVEKSPRTSLLASSS